MIKVLVVDDSAVVRQILSRELSKATDIQVVGTAVDPYVAREKILALHPDVVTLDLEMPRMGGLAFLRKLMKYYPLPVIVVSSLTAEGSEAALRALELGAVDVVTKPGPGYSVADVTRMITERVRAAAHSGRRKKKFTQSETTAIPAVAPAPDLSGCSDRVIAIGASTGGTVAIKEILVGLPADTPGVVICQHMPAGFTAAFANRLNTLCLVEVREAQEGDRVEPGSVLIAPGNRHMTVRRNHGDLVVQLKDGPAVHHQRPSVDVLFHSVARQAGPDAIGALCTGMGRDGAQGLLAMRQAGAHTIAQDEETSVVFGMPREAIHLDAVDKIAPVSHISHCILRALAKRRPAKCTAPDGAERSNE
jgi:two-component system, chemotaxis family, protein-glutamate methylesterase/glutaminase